MCSSDLSRVTAKVLLAAQGHCSRPPPEVVFVRVTAQWGRMVVRPVGLFVVGWNMLRMVARWVGPLVYGLVAATSASVIFLGGPLSTGSFFLAMSALPSPPGLAMSATAPAASRASARGTDTADSGPVDRERRRDVVKTHQAGNHHRDQLQSEDQHQPAMKRAASKRGTG